MADLSDGDGRKSWYLHALMIAIIGVIAYSNTFGVPFQFDDPVNIIEKPYVRDISYFTDFLGKRQVVADHGFRMRTVGYFAFALNYWLGGADVAGYHVVNLVIHLVNGFLVYWLIVLTFRTPYVSAQQSSIGVQRPLVSNQQSPGTSFIALFTALLFVAHPIQTEAVTYIVQRVASLAALFCLLSLVMYAGSRLTRRQSGKLAGYVLSLMCAVLAMKTKEIAFTLPLAITLYEFMFFTGPVKKRLLPLLPLLLTMLIIPVSLIGVEKPVGEIIGDAGEATRVHTGISRWEYLFTQFRVIVTYIRLLFFPLGQNLDYDYPLYHSFFDPNVLLSFLFLTVMFGTAVSLLLKSHGVKSEEQGRNDGMDSVASTPGPVSEPRTPSPIHHVLYRLIAFGIFWFFITLSVESSFIPIIDVIFEHRLYLPSVGFLLSAVSALVLLLNRFGVREKRAVVVVLLLVVVFSGLTYSRNAVWQTEAGLWEDVVRKSPMKARPHHNLGFELSRKGLMKEAVEQYRLAIQLQPDFPYSYNSLGVAYKKLGLVNDAITQYQLAIQLFPDFAESYNNLGNVYREVGLINKSVEQYETAIRLKPYSATFRNNLGAAYLQLGFFDRALEEFRIAIRLQPDFAEAYSNMATIYAGMGMLDSAIEHFERAVKLNPGDSHFKRNLERAYAEKMKR